MICKLAPEPAAALAWQNVMLLDAALRLLRAHESAGEPDTLTIVESLLELANDRASVLAAELAESEGMAAGT